MADEGGNEDTGGGGDIATRPDHVDAKFWNTDSGTVNTEAWSKSYNEMGKQIRTKSATMEKDLRAQIDAEWTANRPETSAEYTLDIPDGFEMPEDMEWEFSDTDPMIEYMREVVHALGGDQAMFDEHLTGYMNSKLDSMSDWDAELQLLGDHGPERMGRVEAFIKANLSDEGQEAIFGMTDSAAGIEAFEELMGKMGEPAFTPQDFSGDNMAAGLDELREMQKDERYWKTKDPAYIKEVDAAYVKLYGDGTTAV